MNKLCLWPGPGRDTVLWCTPQKGAHIMMLQPHSRYVHGGNPALCCALLLKRGSVQWSCSLAAHHCNMQRKKACMRTLGLH